MSHRPAPAYVPDDDAWLVACWQCGDIWPCQQATAGSGHPAHYRVTNAPEEYDGWGNGTVEWLPYVPKAGRPHYRRVRIGDDSMGWQLARYASGMYGCVTEIGFAEWERLRIVRYCPLTPEQQAWNQQYEEPA